MLRFAKTRGAVALLGVIALVSPGCGLSVMSADLFVLERTGQGRTLTLLVSDGGTIRCNGGQPKSIPDPLLLQARELATNLDKDAKAQLSLSPGPRSVYTYKLKLQNGTVSFSDTSAATHRELAPAELFAAQTAHSVCGLP
jgi:hypothetical protein